MALRLLRRGRAPELAAAVRLGASVSLAFLALWAMDSARSSPAMLLPAPPTNPLGTPNHFWEWRGQRVRYQALGAEQDGPSVILVHGLFVNADHWRQQLPALRDAGYRAFALDLLGYGYSSKPPPCGEVASSLNGENGRDLGEPEVKLGTADGGSRTSRVPLRHPLGSAYNFYTWSEQVREFAREVVQAGPGRTTLVANSIGTISSLQAAVDEPDLFNGIFVVNPNFRELHYAEMPPFLRPVLPVVQGALRSYGKPLFDALANPGAVKEILKEPYHDPERVTDELVEVLLTPLLDEGAADVVFDTLSYSAGPLPEQLLQDGRLRAPVWICYGEEDPWTPNARVRSLGRFDRVSRVVGVPGAGHCPHDEAPGLVNPLILEFLKKVVEQ